MGDIENKLKEMIIEKYGSLAKFANEIDMSWTTLDSILKRGILKANIVNVLKITNKLGIDTDQLGKGEIVKSVDFYYQKDPESPGFFIEHKPSRDASEQGVSMDQITNDDLSETTDKYYLDPEVAEMAQELYSRPEMRVLFDATKNVSKDDIQFVIDMLDRMKK